MSHRFFSPARACLRSHGRAAATALILLSSAALSHAQAQASATPPVPSVPTRLESVAITASRAPLRIDDSLAEITLIERAQIEQASGRTLAELLGRQGGVQFWAYGGMGKTSSVSLRGLDSRHTLLLIDGVRYGSASVGSPVWENLPLSSIERIEIVRGPLSGLYGSDAVGGVVQVFTRAGAPGLQLDAAALAGSQRTHEANAGLRMGDADFDAAVQVGQTRTRGISATNPQEPFGSFNADADGFRQLSAGTKLGWRFAQGWRIEANALASHGRTQLDDGPGADARAALTTEVLGLSLGGPVLPGWRSSVRVARALDAYDTLASASAFTPLGEIRSVQQQLSWENTLATPLGTAVLLAEHLRQEVSMPEPTFVVSQRTINGVAAGLSGRAGVHTWQANLRHDRNSQFGGQTTGTLGYGIDVAAQWRAGGSLGTSFVAPSFNLLYYPGFSNPNLLPETGKHAELSLRWADAGQLLRMAWFDNRLRGFITPGPNPGNVDARSNGVALSYEVQGPSGSLTASAEHLDPRNAGGDANAGKQLPRRARNSLKLGADTAWGEWRGGATLAAFSARFDDAANTARLGGFATLDLHADWSLHREWTLGLRLNNAANRDYQTVLGFNQSGREGFVSLRYSGR
jgi:vitamin B12 transporter